MLKRKAKFWFLVVIVLVSCFTFISTSYAVPTFYLSPGLNPGADLDGDIAFQDSVSMYDFVEEDFDSYSHVTYFPEAAPHLVYDQVGVTMSMSNGNTPAAWHGSWGAGTGATEGSYGDGLYGAFCDIALASYGDYAQAPDYTFTFSGDDVVKGFGIWIFDDNTEIADSFTLTALGFDGNTYTSGVLDSNPGSMNHAIEGFIGVKLDEGINSVTIHSVSGGGFHLDHMQIASAPVPEPSTVLLMALGLIGFVGVRFRRKRS